MASTRVRRLPAFLASLALLGGLLSMVVAGPASAAGPYAVNTTKDTVDASPGDLSCADTNGKCSLRAAVMESNADSGAETVTVPAGLYKITIGGQNENGALQGDLDVTGGTTIKGAGSSKTTVDGNGKDRVFDVTGTLHLSGLTIIGGHPTVGFLDFGGAINSYGIVSVTRSVIRGNRAGSDGGGIYSTSDQLTITDTTISGNRATNGVGGGVGSEAGLTITRSTISGNTSTDDAGGVANYGTGTIANSTVSGNSSGAEGGGVFTSGNLLTLANDTITANSAAVDGAGLFVLLDTSITSTIIAKNTTGPDCAGTAGDFHSQGHNLASDGSCHFTGPGDIPSKDPKLGPLADNGGPTLTRTLLGGSPAIDKGALSCPPPATDQRGTKRPVDGNGDGTARCDMGAVEIKPDLTPPTIPKFTLAQYQTTTAFALSWHSTDPDNPPSALSFKVQWQKAHYDGRFGPFTTLSHSSPTSAHFSGQPGYTYCFRARASDPAGNLSKLSTPKCTSVPMDDRLLAGSGWNRGKGSGYYLGTFTSTTQHGKALASPRVEGHDLALLVEECPTCGSIRVLFNGDVKLSRSLHATSTRKKAIVPIPPFQKILSGVVRVEVTSSNGHLVSIDGLAVRRISQT